MGTCEFVLNVTGLNLRFQECESFADAILLRLEEIQRYRPRIMSLQKFGSLGLKIVTFEDVCVAFLFDGGVELGELRRDEAAQRRNSVFRDLDAPVVLLNCGFNIRHIECFSFTVGAFRVPTGTDEVRVDDAPAALGIGHHESGATLTTEHGAFEVVIVGLSFLT